MRFRRHFFSRVVWAVRLLSNELNVIFIMRKADGHFRGQYVGVVLPCMPTAPPSGKMPSETGKGFRRHFYDAVQALGFNAAASLARRVMVSQSLFFTASFGVSHEPPTHRTLGSAK